MELKEKNKKEIDSMPEEMLYSEFLAVLTRNREVNRDGVEALDILENLLLNFKILSPNEKSFQKLVELIHKYHPQGLWIHDIEIASIGLSCGINRIVTQNIDDFQGIKEVEVETLKCSQR